MHNICAVTNIRLRSMPTGQLSIRALWIGGNGSPAGLRLQLFPLD